MEKLAALRREDELFQAIAHVRPALIIAEDAKMRINALPHTEGEFVGREAEITEVAAALLGPHPARLLTIRGTGGQGKTALAREVVDRFGTRWPGGVWAVSLENLPTPETFLAELADFLGVTVSFKSGELGQRVFARLNMLLPTLFVLDGADGLVEAVYDGHAGAVRLARLIRQYLIQPPGSVLATSRRFLGWPGEKPLELLGLSDEAGAELFRQYIPQRAAVVDTERAKTLSRAVGGHPLSIRLLAGAFNETGESLDRFLNELEQKLLAAEDVFGTERHRTLETCMKISARDLSEELKFLLSGLWIFSAPFLPEIASMIFEPDDKRRRPMVKEHLYKLWQRGLLERSVEILRDGEVTTYRLIPAVRAYVRSMDRTSDRDMLLKRFGYVYASLARTIYREKDRSASAIYTAQQVAEDLDQAIRYVGGETLGHYLLHWGYVLGQLGNRQRALHMTEEALQTARKLRVQTLELSALNNLALLYADTGELRKALRLYEQALELRKKRGDQPGEATTLNNMGAAYYALGQPKRALILFEQALPLRRKVKDRAGEAATLNNTALVYQTMGQPQQALRLYEQALPIMQEVGDRSGEAATLNNMAMLHYAAGRPPRALELYDEALAICREVGDRAREVNTLNNMAGVYAGSGHPDHALVLYEEVLPIMKEVGDRTGEAATLNNMAAVYHAMGKLKRALKLCKEALPIVREIEDRTGEATTLNNMALVYYRSGQPWRALSYFEEALPIHRQISDRAMEAATCYNLATLLHSEIGRTQDAIIYLERCVAIDEQIEHPNLESDRALLERLRASLGEKT
jgi:tetratricopeptide (TPR) repeat protein